jgi:hypothetical protein
VSRVGLSQAPMFAAAATLPSDRATTGCAVLNMSRQIGNAIRIAVLIALTAGHDPIAGFDHAWEVQAGLALAAAGVLVLFGRHTTAARHERRTAPGKRPTRPMSWARQLRRPSQPT